MIDQFDHIPGMTVTNKAYITSHGTTKLADVTSQQQLDMTSIYQYIITASLMGYKGLELPLAYFLGFAARVVLMFVM